MTTGQMMLITALYLAALIAVAYFTRATLLRNAGAAAGGVVFGGIALLAVSLGEMLGWWRVPRARASYFELLFWLAIAVSCAPVYLITWRVARRFGGRGLAVCVAIAAIIGPPRDYAFAATFPDWIVFSPGMVPIMAVATIYALLVILGHSVMRMIAGPARGDQLARRNIQAES